MKSLIPNALTALNLILGFGAIIYTFNGQLVTAAWLVVAAMVADGLDGRVARYFKVSGDFGKELDSLCDVVSFGVVPAIMAYVFLLKDFGLTGALVAAAFATCGAFRLARFNVNASTVKGYFMGLPIPANALFFIGIIIAIENDSMTFIEFFGSKTNYFITPLFMGILMVSFGFRMFSTKGMTKIWQDNIFQYIMAVAAILIIIIYRYAAVSYIVLFYVFLSIINTLTSIFIEKKQSID